MFVFLLQPVPLSLFFGAGGKNSVQNKTFQKIHDERHYALPRGLLKLVFPFFFWGGGGVKMVRCLSLLSPTP